MAALGKARVMVRDELHVHGGVNSWQSLAERMAVTINRPGRNALESECCGFCAAWDTHGPTGDSRLADPWISRIGNKE